MLATVKNWPGGGFSFLPVRSLPESFARADSLAAANCSAAFSFSSLIVFSAYVFAVRLGVAQSLVLLAAHNPILLPRLLICLRKTSFWARCLLRWQR